MRRERDWPTGRARELVDTLAVLEKRWTLRILWALRSHPLTVRELKARLPGASLAGLHARLHELEALRVVIGGRGFQLSHRGRDLLAMVRILELWLDDWPPLGAADPRPRRRRYP